MSRSNGKSKIRVLGDDYRLFLPSEILKAWHVEPGDYVRLTADMELQQMIIRPVRE